MKPKNNAEKEMLKEVEKLNKDKEEKEMEEELKKVTISQKDIDEIKKNYSDKRIFKHKIIIEAGKKPFEYNIKAVKIQPMDEIIIENQNTDIKNTKENLENKLNDENDDDIKESIENDGKKNIEDSTNKAKENIAIINESINDNKPDYQKKFDLYHPYTFDEIKDFLNILDENKLSDCLNKKTEPELTKIPMNFSTLAIKNLSKPFKLAGSLLKSMGKGVSNFFARATTIRSKSKEALKKKIETEKKDKC